MKKLIMLCLLFIPVFIHAQDLIIDKYGKKINCDITSEDSVNVYLTIMWNHKPINTLIHRSEIRSIHYNYHLVKHEYEDSIARVHPYTKCFTVGVLNGGGSLVGLDIEIKIVKPFAIQVGAGFVGFGAGLNLHLKPSLRSSFMSLQYWHQGVGDSYAQSLVGPSFTFRAKKLFTAQIGLGFALEKGPAWGDFMKQPEVMLTYSIGLYFPN